MDSFALGCDVTTCIHVVYQLVPVGHVVTEYCGLVMLLLLLAILIIVSCPDPTVCEGKGVW